MQVFRLFTALSFCLASGAAFTQYNSFPPGVFTSRSALDAASSGGAVLFDAASNAFIQGGGTTLSWTHPGGTPTAAAVGVNNGDSFTTITGITYGGVSMALAQSKVYTTGSSVQLWGLANPPSGAQTIVISYVGTPTTLVTSAGAITVTNSDTTTCFSASNSNNSTSPVSTTVAANANDLVVDVEANAAGDPITPGGSQTTRWTQGGVTWEAKGTTQLATGSTTMSASAAGDPMGIAAGAFKHQ